MNLYLPTKIFFKKLALYLKNNNIVGFLFFLIPSLLGTVYFVLLPFGDAVYHSFTNATTTQFVGIQNYKNVLGNEAFKLAILNTSRFIIVCIPLLLLCSLLLALLINKVLVGANFYKTSFLLPMVIPVASMVLLWKMFFAKQGIVNSMLSHFGFTQIDWMNTQWSFVILVGVYIWRNIGYDIILWLAGLSNIPTSLYEAAQIDGAGSLQCFFYVTLPQLRPSLFVISVLSILNSFKVFREAYLVAGNYPHDSIYMLQHLFNNWFTSLDIQRLCAAAVLMAFVIIILIILLQIAWGKDDNF